MTQTHHNHHEDYTNHAIAEALRAAQEEKAKREIKEHPEKFSREKLKEFCSDNNITVSGDRRFKKTFVNAIRKFLAENEKKKKDVRPRAVVVPIRTSRKDTSTAKHGKNKKHERRKFNYPADLVNCGKPGKYCLFISTESEIQAEVVETENGKKCVYILHATGEFSELIKDDVHKEWFIPFVAVKHRYFIAPRWMAAKQKYWVISALRAILRLHRIFEARVKRAAKKNRR